MAVNKADMLINKNVEALLAKMSVEQKIGQMIQVERSLCTPEEVKKYHIGSVLSGAGSAPKENNADDWVEMIEEYWQASNIQL